MGGSLFHSVGPATSKARSPFNFSRVLGYLKEEFTAISVIEMQTPWRASLPGAEVSDLTSPTASGYSRQPVAG